MIRNFILTDGSEVITDIDEDTLDKPVITMINPMVYVISSDGETRMSVLERFIPMAKGSIVYLPQRSILAYCSPDPLIERYYMATLDYNLSFRDKESKTALARAVKYLETTLQPDQPEDQFEEIVSSTNNRTLQ